MKTCARCGGFVTDSNSWVDLPPETRYYFCPTHWEKLLHGGARIAYSDDRTQMVYVESFVLPLTASVALREPVA